MSMRKLYAVIGDLNEQNKNTHGCDNRIFKSEYEARDWAACVASSTQGGVEILEIPAVTLDWIDP